MNPDPQPWWLQVQKIWIGSPEDEKGQRGHSGLGDNTSDEDLERYFAAYGTVTKVNQLMWPDTKKKRGYGYIEFTDTDAVDKVVLSKIHVVNGVRLEVKKAVIRQPGEKGGSGGGGSNAYGMGGGSMMGGMSNMGGYSSMGGVGGGYAGMMGGMMDGSSMYGGGSMMGGSVGGWGSGGGETDARGNARKRGFESSRYRYNISKIRYRYPPVLYV
jgi:heterogeneous nuclear ribonucleoprotein A1/A3